MVLRSIVFGAFIALLAACGETTPQPKDDIEVGFVFDDEFRPLAPKEVLWVREAVQTGKWIMPSVRVWGVEGVALAQAEVTLADGRPAGGFTANLPFIREDEATGAMRFDLMPIPIASRSEDAPLDGIYGQDALLEVWVEQNGHVHACEYEIRLENGD